MSECLILMGNSNIFLEGQKLSAKKKVFLRPIHPIETRVTPPGEYLVAVNLNGADLIRADLSGADLSNANLSGADMSDANLSGAILPDALMDYSDLRSVKNLDPKEVKRLRDWDRAFYDDETLRVLGLPSDHNDKLANERKKEEELQQKQNVR